MSARTTLADGTVVRWHSGDLEECRRADCVRPHASKAELLAPDDELDSAHWYEQGKAAAKGELS